MRKGVKGNTFPFIKQFIAIRDVHLTNTTNQTHTEQMEYEPNMYGYPG